MQILGKVEIQGKEKEVLLKEENEFFKYYSLELIGAYAPQIGEQKIVFKKDIALSKENKIEIIKLVNRKVTPEILQKNDIFQMIGQIDIEGKQKELLVKKKGEILKYYYLNLIGVYTPRIPGETIIFRQDTLENAVSADIKDNEQKNAISPLEKEQIQRFLERIQIRNIIEKLRTQERGVKERTQYNKKIKVNEINQKQQKQNRKEVRQKQQNQPEKVNNKIKDINIKQEVNMDTRVTDMSNLEQVLQKNKKMPKLEHGSTLR